MFLPGYDEIVGVRDRILDDQRFNDSNRYVESPSNFQTYLLPVSRIRQGSRATTVDIGDNLLPSLMVLDCSLTVVEI